MEEKKINANNPIGMGIDPAKIKEGQSVFKRARAYIYKQVFWESVQVSTTQTASEKVASTVATFLNKGSNGILL